MDNTKNEEMIISPLQEDLVISEENLGLGTEIENDDPAFIESNTQGISFEELTTKNLIPTFADGTLSLSHGSIIKATMKAAEQVFGELAPVQIRVSHRVQGRTPEAMDKLTSELTEEDKTEFYQRMGFVIRAKNFTRVVNGVEVNLCVGGTRSYAEEKLFGRPAPAHIKLVCGWHVRLCSNGCITTSGTSGTLNCLTEADVFENAIKLFQNFSPEKEDVLGILENLGRTSISEEQLCHVIGRLRLYQALPLAEQEALPRFILGDNAINKVAQGYISNETFGRKNENSITLWSLLNLMNEAVKQGAYINDWVDRNINCTDFVLGIQKALLGQDEECYDWFLN